VLERLFDASDICGWCQQSGRLQEIDLALQPTTPKLAVIFLRALQGVRLLLSRASPFSLQSA
jgi:hypothetical protein